MNKKIYAAFLLLLFTAIMGSAIAASHPPAHKNTPLILQLQWLPNDSQFAGYYAAQVLGFYKDEGLKVTFKGGNATIEPQKQLADKKADLAISWLPKVLIDPNAKNSLVNIAQIFQRNGTLEVSWKKSGITKPADWRYKKVGTWGGGNEYELYAAMHDVGIDPLNKKEVTIVKQAEDMSAFLEGKLDAAQTMSYNEYYQILKVKNPKTGEFYRPKDLSVIDFNNPKIATAMLADGIYARKDWIKKPENQATAIKFLRASFKGWIYCRDNFDECKNLIVKISPHHDEKFVTWSLNEINALIWPSPQGIGMMDHNMFLRTIKIMWDNNFISYIPNNDLYRVDLAQKALEGLQGDTKGKNYQKKSLM